ncbi:MAG: hypothetical protein ACRDLF_03495 [Solirubrobacteraceae bacterium]
MIASRLTVAGLVSLSVSCAALVLACAPAQATVVHKYLSQITEVPAAPGVSAPGPFGAMESMSVDAGQLWVAERFSGGSRADEFNASTGAFVSQLVPTKATPFSGEGGGIAVGHGTGQAEIYAGATNESGEPVVAVFEAGALQATWTGADTPGGSFGEGIRDIAVDNSTDPLDEGRGDVYVAVLSQHVIDVFRPEAGGKEKYVTQLTGISPSEPFSFPFKVDVNEANGDVIVLEYPGGSGAVDVFEPTALGYTFVRKIQVNRSAFDLAVDGGSGESNGEIYVTEGFFPTVINQFSATGAYLGHITGAGSPGGDISDVYSLAVDPASHDVYIADNRPGQGEKAVKAFGPDIVLPTVTTEPVSEPKVRSATLTGTVNPEKAGAATCGFVWGSATDLGHTAPCEPEGVAEGENPVPVKARIGGLEPDAEYCYRLQAANANGANPGEASQDRCFTTPGPGLNLELVSVSEVTAESAMFDATIDPRGRPTSYYFQYGTTSGYGTDLPAAPGAPVGSGQGNVQLSQATQGLQAGTVYHYRVVVLSEVEAGDVEEFDGPDQTFTTQRAGGFALPDGRQWEMVSPPRKEGARINTLGYGAHGVIEAAADGGALTYNAEIPTEAEPVGFDNAAQILSTRVGVSSWQTRDLTVPHEREAGPALGNGAEYRFFSEDLSLAVVQPMGPFTPCENAEGARQPCLSPEASEQTPFLHTDYLGGDVSEPCLPRSMGCDRPLVTGCPKAGPCAPIVQEHANVPPGTFFGGNRGGSQECGPGDFCGPYFYAATPDLSHVVLQSQESLTPGGGGEFGLYEWATGGKLTFIGNETQATGIYHFTTYGSHGISEDGSRVVFGGVSEGIEGRLLMRDTATGETVKIVGEGEQHTAFQTANADDSKVFFSSGGELYVFEAAAGSRLLAGTVTSLTAGAGFLKEGRDKVLGASEDGSYVYFVSGGVLPGSGASSPGDNLYVDHYDGSGWKPMFIAALSSEDEYDWAVGQFSNQPTRVSPNGQWLAFMSAGRLTGYDNRDALSGRPAAEVYLYNASSGALVCASCDPTGARPTGVEYRKLELSKGGSAWLGQGLVAANLPGWQENGGSQEPEEHQTRYLSNSGRLFFDSGGALVPQDVNGTEDVYEYEPEGVGGCTSSASSGSVLFKPARGFAVEGRSGVEGPGCVGLISSGTSSEESAFLDASESGADVFFLTSARLAAQDQDTALDVYDAHECSAVVPCSAAPVLPTPCDTEASCKPSPTPQPSIYGLPSSATFAGPGNIASLPAAPPVVTKKTAKCGRPRRLSHGRCLRAKPKRRKASGKRSNRRAG